jgi:hypothetical protein
MDFHVWGATLPCAGDVFAGYLLAAALHFSGGGWQGLHLVRYGSVFRVALDVEHQLLVIAQMICSHGSMNVLAKEAVVARGDEAAISSRSPGERVFGPRRSTSASWLRGSAVSGRNTINPRMPGRSSGNCMCAMV